MKTQKNQHQFPNGSKISLHQIVRKQMNKLKMTMNLLIWSSYKGKVIMFYVGQQELKNKYSMKSY